MRTNPNIEALDNKISILEGRKKKMHDYLIEYPESEHIKKEIEAITLSISEAQQALKDEYESNISTII